MPSGSLEDYSASLLDRGQDSVDPLEVDLAKHAQQRRRKDETSGDEVEEEEGVAA